MRMLRRTRKRTRRTTRSEKALSCAVRGCFSCRPRLCQLEDAPRVLQLLSTFSPPWHSSGGGRPCVARVRDVMSGLGRGIRGPRQIENSSNCRSSTSAKCRRIAQHVNFVLFVDMYRLCLDLRILRLCLDFRPPLVLMYHMF